MTDKYHAYIQLMTSRDSALVSLAAIAVITVLAWEALRMTPDPWRSRLTPLYLIGGYVLYLGTLIALTAWNVEGL